MSQKQKYVYLSRKKLQFFVKSILIFSVIFILYQLIMFIQLTKEINKDLQPNLIVGVHELQRQFYVPKDGKFVCIISMEKIQFKLINDNYCDCQDGSDEPGTNACSNGQFFCTEQNHKRYPNIIPSNRVNDGICDCCDGSDEWLQKKLSFRLTEQIQNEIQKYQSPCPYRCNR